MNSRYTHARQIRRTKWEQKKLKTYLDRLYRNILRNSLQSDKLLAILLTNARRLMLQQKLQEQALQHVRYQSEMHQ